MRALIDVPAGIEIAVWAVDVCRTLLGRPTAGSAVTNNRRTLTKKLFVNVLHSLRDSQDRTALYLCIAELLMSRFGTNQLPQIQRNIKSKTAEAISHASGKSQLNIP